MVEKIESKQENKLITSEAAKEWTEHSPNSRLNKINSRLKSAQSNEGKELRNLLVNREYKQFQSKIWLTRNVDLDWKLWPNTFRYFRNYIKKFERENTAERKTNDKLQQLKQNIEHPEQRDNIQDSIKISKSAKQYLSEHETLSEEDYNAIFSWKESLQQWQIWNCYLISWINELCRTQYFDTLMRTSISRVKFRDDWELWYRIKVPLWEPDGRDILIKDFELNTAKVKWNTGYQLLEIAYVKNRRKNDSEWNKYYPVTEGEYEQTERWLVSEVLWTFLGNNNIGFSCIYPASRAEWGTLNNLSEDRKNEIANILRNYNWYVWNRFVYFTTPQNFALWDRSNFRVWNHTLYNSHAYSLNYVRKDSYWNIVSVNVRNPWNNYSQAWGANLDLTFYEFLNAFAYIWVWTIKTETFLDNKWTNDKKSEAPA